jgi:hypothetical protein
VGLGVGLGVGFTVGTGVGLGVGFTVGLGVGFTVGLGVGFTVGLGVGFTVGLGVENFNLIFGLKTLPGMGAIVGLVIAGEETGAGLILRLVGSGETEGEDAGEVICSSKHTEEEMGPWPESAYAFQASAPGYIRNAQSINRISIVLHFVKSNIKHLITFFIMRCFAKSL